MTPSDSLKLSPVRLEISAAYSKLNDLDNLIKKVQSWTDTPICIDSEGAQVRNQDMVSEAVQYEEESHVKIHHEKILGDSGNISFTPETVSTQLKVDDVIRVDFDAVQLKVIRKEKKHLLAVVENGGLVGSNKATDINRKIYLDALTK